MNIRSLLTPARVLFAYVFLVQFVGELYAIRQIEIPTLFDALSRIAFFWLLWWWLIDDSRRRGITWMMDLGMFLYIAWILILPYHLFKTRGFAAFIPILTFILAAICGIALAVVVSTLL